MTSLLDLIGETPLVEVTRFDTGPCRLFLKLESQNPSGSIKDRPARAMIAAAEADGRLKPGGTIVEATAGNTGLGLALVAARKGYHTVLVVPDKMAREKLLHCKALGAELVLTRSDVGKGHPDYYQDLADAIADAESFATARELLRLEGILAGSSSGTLLAAALRYCRAQEKPQRVVTLVCDSGAKYLSKVFNPSFLAQEGWAHLQRHGTVGEVVINRFDEGAAVV